MHKADRSKIDRCIDEIVRVDMSRLWPKLFECNIYSSDDVNIPQWEVINKCPFFFSNFP